MIIKIRIFDHLPEEAKKIREEVFVKEQGFREEFDGIDEMAIHIVLFDGEKAVGTCRLFSHDSQPDYHVGRVAVTANCRGRGLGKMLMDAAEEKVRDLGGASITLSGQVRVSDFYEKLGYCRQGEEYLDEGCPHVKMTKRMR